MADLGRYRKANNAIVTLQGEREAIDAQLASHSKMRQVRFRLEAARAARRLAHLEGLDTVPDKHIRIGGKPNRRT